MIDSTHARRLAQTERPWRDLFAQAFEPMLLVARDGRLIEANPAAASALGDSCEDLSDLSLARLVAPEAFVATIAACERAFAGERVRGQPSVLLTRRGASLPVTLDALPATGDADACLILREPDAPGERAALTMAIFDNSFEGILITDGAGNIRAVNAAFTAITGYPEAEVLGRNPRLLQSGRQGPEFYAAMWASIERTGAWQGEIWNRRRSGEVYPEWLTVSAVRGAGGRIVNLIGQFSDISALKASQERLDHLAHHDPLTDLPNRLLFGARLEQALRRAQRGGAQVGLLYLDLDDFKPVNDRLGHETGDALLIEVGARLRASLRAEDTVARLGGDEFAIILESIRGREDAVRLAHLAKRTLQAPVALGGETLQVSASVGVAVAPEDGADPASLVRAADRAMYRAKAGGRAQGAAPGD